MWVGTRRHQLRKPAFEFTLRFSSLQLHWTLAIEQPRCLRTHLIFAAFPFAHHPRLFCRGSFFSLFTMWLLLLRRSVHSHHSLTLEPTLIL